MIQNGSLRLSVLGSGYVGLPTAALLAEAGFSVVAVNVESINSGISLIVDLGLQELVKRNVLVGRLSFVGFQSRSTRHRRLYNLGSNTNL